jgi:polar amino acid transport system substrate-binding protein
VAVEYRSLTGGTRTAVRGPACIALALVATLFGACRIPEDPDGTLDRVEGGEMRVGVTESDPWVTLREGVPTGGVEVELVRSFARDLDARIEWVDGAEEELIDALKEGALDLVIGGLTSKSRWKKDVAFTRPYVKTRTVVGVPPESSPPDDLDGVLVAVELGSEAEALLDSKTDARLRPVDDLGEAGTRPVAAHDYVLDDLGLAIGPELKEDEQVMAVRMGENAFMVRLERFLLNREDEIERLLLAEGRP